jgi:hypothetical protein
MLKSVVFFWFRCFSRKLTVVPFWGNFRPHEEGKLKSQYFPNALCFLLRKIYIVDEAWAGCRHYVYLKRQDQLWCVRWAYGRLTSDFGNNVCVTISIPRLCYAFPVHPLKPTIDVIRISSIKPNLTYRLNLHCSCSVSVSLIFDLWNTFQKCP